MHLDAFITDLALITAVSASITLVFRKLRLPVVLGYIIAGFFISPNFIWLPTIVEMENIQTWANIGIVFLMFALGLEFGFRKLADIGVPAVVNALTIMTGMMTVGYLVAGLLGWSRIDGIFLGGILSISSTMIIKKVCDEYDISHTHYATLALGTLVIEEIFAVILMVLLAALAVSRDAAGIDILVDTGSLILFLGFWVAMGIYLIPTLLKRTRHLLNDEILLILILALCFGMVVLFSIMGFSEALGAFAAGSILSGTVMSDRIEKLVAPLKDLFGAIFFVSVGMMVSPPVLMEFWPVILLLSALVVFGQMMFATMGILFSGQTLRTAVCGGFCMVQIGEFSFILAVMGDRLGVTDPFLLPVVVSVSVITILTTPLFVLNGERAADLAERVIPRGIRAFIKKYSGNRDNTAKMDRDWKRFMSVYFTRILICSGGLLLIYLGALKWVAPLMDTIAKEAAGLLTTLISLLAMIPLIAMLWSRRGVLLPKLWLKSKSNRIPLIALHGIRMVIALAFLILVFDTFLEWPKSMLFLLAVVVLILVIRSDFLKGQTIKAEARFISNLNEKLLHGIMEERASGMDEHWLGDKVCVVEFTVAQKGKPMTIRDLYASRMLNLLIIKVIRNERHMLMPDMEANIQDKDQVHVIGTKEHLDAYLLHLQNEGHIILAGEHRSTIKEYTYGQVFRKIPVCDQVICSAVRLGKKSEYIKKSIKNSGFKKKYRGSIIAIERGPLPMIAPSINTVLESGDILWVVGTEAMAKRLLIDGLLEN